ncbi:putative ABC transporter permease subunit [Marininema halotolerans]|uniref:Putative ATP-binding cassette n=1 Tax=Marininema halotolerans TaxID=1155944 RepID=A0A1I6U7R7_9BACL|nr:hypothetical protein [Marininema halotolerans]SFS97277.1 Putative ATP-binding cassette [Marininema halotolerans]
MMRGAWALFEVIVRGQYGLSYLTERYKKNIDSRWEIPATLVLLVLLEWMIVGVYQGAYHLLSLEDHPGKVFSILVLGAILWVFFSSVAHMMRQLYFTNDIEWVSGLPLSSSEVLGARMAGVWLGQILVLIVLWLPGLILYGMQLHKGVGFYILVADLMLSLPFFPLVISGWFVLVVVRIVPWGKYRQQIERLLSLLFPLFSFIMIMSINGFMMNAGASGSFTWITKLLDVPNTFASYFYPLHWAFGIGSNGVTAWVNALLFDSFSLCMMVVFLLLGAPLYQRGLQMFRNSSGSQRYTRKKGKQGLRSRSLFRLMLKREYHLLMDTPFFVAQTLVQLIGLPLFIAISFIRGGGIEENEPISVMFQMVILWGSVILCLLMGGMNSILRTISREGRFFYLSKVLPVPYKVQIAAKYTFSMMIMMFACLLVSVIQGILISDWILASWTLVLGILTGSLFSQLGILHDLWRPNLTWQSPKELAKQLGLGNLLFMILSLFLGGTLIFLSWILLKFGKLSFIEIQGIWTLLLIGLHVWTGKGVIAIANRRYQTIQG